jgi:prepilin-type N-terminal cleavage/methylation domain-containing protein
VKRGFTIVELMMVAGVIVVLMGIVTTAASQSIRASRSRRADALCSLVLAGFNAYYAQYDKWPGKVGEQIASGSLGSQGNNEGEGGTSDNDKYVLSGSEVRDCVKALVEETKNGTPVMDISGLFVSRQDGELSGNKVKPSSGMDFMSAIRGTRTSRKKMSTSEMYYGYPDPATGYFLRFKIVYSVPTDTFTVSKQR